MSAIDTPVSASNLYRAASVCLAVATLWLASDLLIPVVFAILLSFVVSPVAARLNRLGVPNVISASIVLGAVGIAAATVLLLTSSQALDLVQRLPEYRENLIERIRSVKSSTNQSLSDLTETVETLSSELSQPAHTAENQQSSTQPAPVAVHVIEPTGGVMTLAGAWVTPLIGPLGSVGVVFLFPFSWF